MAKKGLLLGFFFLGILFYSFAQSVDEFTYTIVTDGNLKTITITGYEGDVAHLLIPDSIENCPVTAIEAEIQWKQNLVEITFPDTLISIGDTAFYGCSKLAKINIPRDIQDIGYGAFGDPTNKIWYGMDRTIRDKLVERFGQEIFESPW
jgi:hypothetical protein